MRSLNDLEERHLESVVEIRGAASIKVLNEYIGEVGSGFDGFEDLTIFNPSWAGVQLDVEMIELPLRFDQIAIHWGSADPAEGLSGEYRVPGPLDILGQESLPLAEKRASEFEREFLLGLRSIDVAYDSSRGWSSHLQMVSGASPLSVWYEAMEPVEYPPYPLGFFKLDLTYHRYMETLVITKGVYGWQYLFADVSFERYDLDGAAGRLRRMLDVFPHIFPNHDYSDLAARLEARL